LYNKIIQIIRSPSEYKFLSNEIYNNNQYKIINNNKDNKRSSKDSKSSKDNKINLNDFDQEFFECLKINIEKSIISKQE